MHLSVCVSVGLSACQPAFCNQAVLRGGGGGLEELCAERNILFPHFQRPCWPTWRPVILTETASGKEPQRQTGWQTDRQDRDWVTDRQTKELRGGQMDRWNIDAGRQEQRETDDWRCGQTREERASGIKNCWKVKGPIAFSWNVNGLYLNKHGKIDPQWAWEITEK